MAGRARERVLEVLAASTEPLDAAEVAERLDIHVTTARFHLNNLITDGEATSTTLASDSVGRPRVGYTVVRRSSMADLVGLLLDQLGSTPQAREHCAAEAGRLWAAEVDIPAADVDLPDPVTVASDILARLGFRVSGATSIFGSHELRICSCPLKDLAGRHPEIARGVQRGVIEQALAASSPTLASQYAVAVVPDPQDGDCEVTLRLSPRSAQRPATSPASR
ncbi:helix-turn-helix transcriptional regulator [Gordonia soli]|uniref:Transcriptional regulator n=1 Tax=Gordonia soli NBRC 108243 TaxID=1223545 RepID=M0QNH8_9ACTN|nr:transcriptional regulator [Gordonia soli]GAC70128.1 hypothetical protein GS4_32_00720 [Gordonia soli NBRC 108243]